MNTMQCPHCQKEYEDFDGLGVLYCNSCGYCKHASETDGKCDYCGRVNRCITCGTELQEAPGIGPYCPSPECERIDDLMEDIPPVPEQNRRIAELNERIDEMREQRMAWARMTENALNLYRIAIDTKEKLSRLEDKYSRLLKFARKLQNYSNSQAEYIERMD